MTSSGPMIGATGSVNASEPQATDAGRTQSSQWWRGAVLYENHLPSFRDGNGDGIGDLDGLTEGLAYLDEVLGVDAVWVGPFFHSPLLDQGFDVTDHTDVEPVFGSLESFDRLIAEAHGRGMKVIVDYIPNHTSDQHPWFVESRSSRESAKRNWYVWADPDSDGGPPNNWVSEAGGSMWELDEPTGQYYLHSHLREQPDLNWRQREVREAMLDVLRFWLNRGADGVRIDVAHMLMKDPELRDNPPNPDGEANPYDIQHPDFHTQLHVNDRMHPDVHDVLGEIRALLDDYGDRVAIGEVEATDWKRWASFYGAELDGLHLPFAFQLIETQWNARALADTIGALEAALPDGAWPILALGNHDRPRLATRIGPDQARVAATLLLTLRGTPTLLYGDELGLTDQAVPPSRQRDHFGLTQGGASRDPTRTPMPWNAGPNGGFAPADATDLWLPICREYEAINVEAQLAVPESSLSLYRRLLRLRRSDAALREGDYGSLPRAEAECLLYTREAEGRAVLVALNLTGESRRLEIERPGLVLLSTTADREGESIGEAFELRGGEAVVVELAPEGRSTTPR